MSNTYMWTCRIPAVPETEKNMKLKSLYLKVTADYCCNLKDTFQCVSMNFTMQCCFNNKNTPDQSDVIVL